MANNEHNPNVTLGDWRRDANYATENRICTYADLVDKTLAVSTEVYHEMGGDDNSTNVFIVNGRKSLTYQQLSHCSDVKVYLKTSSTSEEHHLYRFNGAIGHLCRFSCDKTDPSGNEYSYNLCVDVGDIKVIENINDLRFRFKNITFPPILKFIPGTATDDYCTEVQITRLADQVDPHDVYIQMQNGRRAKFQFIQEPPTTFDYDSDGGIYCSSSGHPSMRYYIGGYEEYLQEFGGDCDVNYTIYDDISTYQCVTSDPNTWNFPQFIVEPYHGKGYVTMIGKRNTPNYVEVQTDGHITVRRLNHQEWTDIDTVGYSGINQFGTIVVMPPDYSGYFTSLIPEVQEIYMSVESQSVTQWDAYKGKIYEYDENGGDEHIYEIPETDYLDLENIGYLIELTDFVGTIKYKHTYRVELNSVEAFHAITVNVNDDKFLTLKYIANETEHDVTTRQVGGHWIHTFQTVEQTNAEPKDITIKAIVNEHTCNDHPELVGNTPETTYSIVKISMAANVNPYMEGFTLGEKGVGKFVVVPYRHNSSNLPNVLNLYVRLLENIKVIFELPLGFGIRVGVNATSEGTLYKYESGDTVIGNYYKKEVPLDVEQDVFLTAGAIQVRLERYDSSLSHGYNTIRGKFYYNTTGSGEDASVIFVGTPYQFNSETSYVILRIEGIIFALTQYYIKLEGYMETTMTIKIVLPKFLSAYSMQLEPARMPAQGFQHDVGGFISPELETYRELHDKVCVWQRTSTKIVSNEGRQSSWTAENAETTTLKYTFSLIDRDVRFLLSSLNDRDSNYNYLPTYIFKKLQFSSGTINQWEHYTTEFTLTNNSYNVNTGSFSTPAFSGLLHNNAENPELVITAEAWERPYIYFAMQSIDVIDINNVNVENGAYCLSPYIVAPNDVNVTNASEASRRDDSDVYSFVTGTSASQLGLSINTIYKMQLPDFYIKSGTSPVIYKMFRVRQQGNIKVAGQDVPAPDGTQHKYSKVLNGYHLDAYIQTSGNNPAWSTSGRIMNNSGLYRTDLIWSSATGQGGISGITSLPWATDASSLNRNLLIVVKPEMGDSLMSFVTLKYWNGTTMKNVNYTEPIYLAPIMLPANVNNSIEIEVYCVNPNSTVKVSLNGTTYSSDYGTPISDGYVVKAKVEKLTGVSGKTHKVTVWADANLFNYNEGNQTKWYYTNKNIPLRIRYEGGNESFEYIVDMTVGPVIKFDFNAPTYVSQEPKTTSSPFTTCVLEYVKDGDNDRGVKQMNYPSFPAYDPEQSVVTEKTVYVPDESNWITKYRFSWTNAGSSTTYTKYFQTPKNAGNGQFTIRSMDSFPDGATLIPESTLDTVVEYTYHPLESDAWYLNSNSDHKAHSTVLNFMSIKSVQWWDGSSMKTETNIVNALLSPVRKESAMKIFVKFQSGHGLNFDNDKHMYALTEDFRRHFDCGVKKSTDSAYDLELTISTKPQVYSNSSKTWVDVDSYGLTSDSETSRYFYTGQPIAFQLFVAKEAGGLWNDSITVTMGPVIAFAHNVASGSFADYSTGEKFGGYLQPKTGQKIVLQSRAHEWYLNNDGNIVMTSNATVGKMGTNNRKVRGREYNIVWNYNNNTLLLLTETASGALPDVDQAELVPGESSYTYTREFRDNGHLRVQHAASWTDLNSMRYYNDDGAWRVYVENDNGLADGTLTASVIVNDVVDNPPEIKLNHWYDGGKTTELSVSNVLSVVGSEYLYGDDGGYGEFVNCGTSLTNLILTDYNGWRLCADGNIYIYINNAGNCEIDLIYNNDDDKTYFKTFLEVNIYDYDELFDDKPCTHLVSLQFKDVSVPDHPLYPLWNSVSGKRMYDGKTIDMKLIGTLNNEVVADYPVRITVGTFGEIYFGISGRVIMQNSPGSTLSIVAFANIVEQNGSSSEYVMHIPDNVLVEEEIEFSDSETESRIEKTYNTTNGEWTFKVPDDDPYDYVDPWWARGHIRIKQRIMRDWYDEFEYKDIVFEKFINFYTEDSQASGKQVALCACGSVMWCTNSRLEDYESFSTSTIRVRDKNNNYHNVYYMSFRVTVDTSGRTVITRISPNLTREYTAYVLVGMLSTFSPYHVGYRKLQNSDFNVNTLNTEHYDYSTYITIMNIEPTGTQVSGMNQYYMYNPSGSDWFRPEVNWNYKWSDNTLQTLDTSQLDDYPIWNIQWRG